MITNVFTHADLVQIDFSQNQKRVSQGPGVSYQTRALNITISIFYRYYLGTFHGAKGFQLLSGIMVQEQFIFHRIYFYVIISISGIAFQYITIKKLLVRFKEYKVKNSIQINIQEKPQEHSEICLDDFLNEDQRQKFNNVRYNDPILSGAVTIGLTFMCFGLLSFFFIVHEQRTNFDDKMTPYLIDFYQMLFIEPVVFRLMLPICHITVSKDLRKFIMMLSKDMGLIK